MAQGTDQRAVPPTPLPERLVVHVRALWKVCLVDLSLTGVQFEHAGLLAVLQVGQQPVAGSHAQLPIPSRARS